MRNLLALLAAIVLIFLGVGGWRGWYGVTRQESDLGKVAFRFEIDAVRIGSDAMQAVKSLSRSAEAAEEARK
jgi:hypothetical protein